MVLFLQFSKNKTIFLKITILEVVCCYCLLILGTFFISMPVAEAVEHYIYSTDFDDTFSPPLVELYRFEDQSLFGRFSQEWILRGNDSECLQVGEGANLNNDRDFYAKWKLEPRSNGVIIVKQKFFYKDNIDIITLRPISSEILSNDLSKDDLVKNVQNKGSTYFDEISPLYQQALKSYSEIQLVLYRGVIGNLPIVMELGKLPDNTIKGRYFYESSGVDIPLFGKESDIVEPYPFKNLQTNGQSYDNLRRQRFDKPKAHFLGTFAGKSFQGQWKPANKKSAKEFKLKEIARLKLDDDEASTDKYYNVYYDFKMAEHTTPYGKIEKGMVLEWQNFIDRRTNVVYPKLLNYRDSNVLEKINDNLQNRFEGLSIQVLECRARQYELATWTDLRTKKLDSQDAFFSFISPKLLILVENIHGDCADAHPNFSLTITGFDLKTGDEINWPDVLDYSLIFNPENPDEFQTSTRDDFMAFLEKEIQFNTPDESQQADMGNESDQIDSINEISKECFAKMKENLGFFWEDDVTIGIGNVGLPYAEKYCEGKLFEIKASVLEPYMKEKGRYLFNLE